MDAATLTVIVLFQFAAALPWACWLSVGVTAIHTWDELVADGGPIWSYLAMLTGVPGGLLKPGYVAFQAAIVALAIVAYTSAPTGWLVALVAVRLADIGVTHGLLRVLRSPNPGSRTSVLLLIDAIAALAAIAYR